MGVASRYLINNGQGCICAKRFLIAEPPLLDAFIKAFVEQPKALPMGDPVEEGSSGARWPGPISVATWPPTGNASAGRWKVPWLTARRAKSANKI